MSDQQLTGDELLKDKYYNLLQDTQNITQQNIALLQDKDDLNQANTALQARIEELMNKLKQSTKTIEELTKSNNAFKIVLQIIEDK
ncbi:37492_t:CDS:1, partial [Gigaspora margarita]